jgi:molybdate transport system substrate-binding protein
VRLRLVGSAAAVAVSALALAACGSSGLAVDGPTSTAPQITGPITVFAAASLKESFTILGEKFRAEHPGVTVTFSFGASSTLATQIVDKAPADVFASASTSTMDTVVQAGAASAPVAFATNTLEIATPTSPTTPVTSLADLATPGVKVAVCQQAVPCGAAAEKLFAQNGLAVAPTSQEVDVKAVLSKVRLGEVDAGIVYVTDVVSAKDSVIGVEIPAAQNVTTTYPIAAIDGSSNAATAQAFVDYVLSEPGQKVLALAGFGPA